MNRSRWVALILLAAVTLAVPAARVIRSLWMTRGGMATFTALVASGNAQDLGAVRSLCSRRYLGSHRVERARGGGVVGLPRNIHRNFRAWVDGEDVRICPTDRVGPVYRLIREDEAWKFDGLAGLVNSDGRVDPAGDDGPSTRIFLKFGPGTSGVAASRCLGYKPHRKSPLET